MDPATRRLGWIDTVRGMAMILVVLHHSLVWSHGGAAWMAATTILASVRMPAFFLVSGMLAVSLVRGSGRVLVRRRIVNLGYLYVLWSALYVVVFAVVALLRGKDAGDAGTWWFTNAVRLDSTLWFLVALLCYFAVAWLVRDVSPWIQIAASALLAVPFLADVVRIPGLGGGHLPEYLVFFLIGVNVRDLLLGAARQVRTRHLVASLATLAVVVLLSRLGIPVLKGALAPVAALVGVVAMVAVCVRLEGTRVGRGVAWVGNRTLPIYLVHWMVLGLLYYVGVTDLPDAFLETVGPVVLTAVVLGLSLLIWAGTRTVMPWLYSWEPLRPRRAAATPATT